MRAVKSSQRARVQPSSAASDASTAADVVLPTERAFLLQLTSCSGSSSEGFAGRLEHLSSGRRVRFATWEAFRAAVGELLEKFD